jgi:hypothetical protein
MMVWTFRAAEITSTLGTESSFGILIRFADKSSPLVGTNDLNLKEDTMNIYDKVNVAILWAELNEQIGKIQNFADRYDIEKWNDKFGKSVGQQVQETVAGILKLYEDVDEICRKEIGI